MHIIQNLFIRICWKLLSVTYLLVYICGLNVIYVYISYVFNYDRHSFFIEFSATIKFISIKTFCIKYICYKCIFIIINLFSKTSDF